MRVRAFVAPFALSLGLCALSVSCAKARADTTPPGPPLTVPAPPPRVLAPIDEPLPMATAAPETPATAPSTPATRPPVPRRSGNTADAEPRPEPTPPAPAAVQQGPAEPAPTETRELRAAPSANTAAAERNVRDLLARAARDLNRVDYGKLSADGRTQYEQSKRFSQQAEGALKDRNYVFAATLADKAATLATELLGR
jgi:hypothetical protein